MCDSANVEKKRNRQLTLIIVIISIQARKLVCVAPNRRCILLVRSSRFMRVTCSFTSVKYSMDGWMTCDFYVFSTVFQSNQDDERLIMKGCVQWSSFTVEKISPRAGDELGALDQ